MKRMYVVLVTAILFITGCKKDNIAIDATGTVKNFTGLDGCGMMIVLESGERLEILSLPANTTLLENRRVRIEYEPEPRASICMAGITVHIISLQYI